MGNILEELTNSDEAKQGVDEVLTGALNVEPSDALVIAVIEHDPHRVMEGLSWGFSDTVVRESLWDSVSELLLGRSWPMYADNLTPEESASFEADLNEAARKFGE